MPFDHLRERRKAHAVEARVVVQSCDEHLGRARVRTGHRESNEPFLIVTDHRIVFDIRIRPFLLISGSPLRSRTAT